MSARIRLPLVLIGLMCAALACGPFTATPRPADIPVPATPQPSQAVPPVPTSQPLPDRGFLVFAAGDNAYPAVTSWLAVDNTDLSLRLIANDVINPHHVAMGLSPSGRQLAFITQDASRSFWGRPTLRIFDADTWQTVLDFPLENEAMQDLGDLGMENEYLDTYRAILELDAVAWSHSGASLAFNAAAYGSSADVYTLDLVTLAITRLTDGPTHSIHLAWSPDDAAILHLAVGSLGTGAGYAIDRIWSVPADGGSSIDLGRGSDMSGDETWLGWFGPHTVVAHSWNAFCGQSDLRLLDIVSGAEVNIHQGCFNAVAYDPDRGQILYAVPSGDDNSGPVAHGVWLYTISDGQSLFVADVPVSEIFHNPGEGAFYFVDEGGAVSRVLSDGALSPLANDQPILLSGMSDTGIIAWRLKPDFSLGPQPGLFISQAGGDPVHISDVIPRASIFSPGGDRLYVLTDDGIYLGEAPAYALTLLYSTAAIGAPPMRGAWLEG